MSAVGGAGEFTAGDGDVVGAPRVRGGNIEVMNGPELPPDPLVPAPPAKKSIPLAPIAEDLFCIRCHYNLKTRTCADLCPECALPVAQSEAHHRDHRWEVVLPGQLAGAAYILAAGMLGGVLCFAGVYGLKMFSDSRGSPPDILMMITQFNYVSHLIYVVAVAIGAYLIGGRWGSGLFRRDAAPVLSLVMVGFTLVTVVTVMLVFSLPRRLRRPGPAFMVMQSIRMGDFVGAGIYLVVVAIGYIVMRNVARSLAVPGMLRRTQAAFGVQLLDAGLGVGIYAWMAIQSARWGPGLDEGFAFSADLFSLIVSLYFGWYWLYVARVVKQRRGQSGEGDGAAGGWQRGDGDGSAAGGRRWRGFWGSGESE